MDADVPRCHGGVVSDHGDVIGLKPELLADDLGQHRGETLADVGAATDDRGVSEVVELEDRATAVGEVDLGAATNMDGRGDADPPADRSAGRQ